MDPTKFNVTPEEQPHDHGAWESAFYSGMGAPETIATPVVKKRFSVKRIAFACIAIMLIASGVTLWFASNTQLACLSAADYAQITGQPHDTGLAAAQDFSTELISFSVGEATYDDGVTVTALISGIGDFVRDHPDTALRVTVAGDYYNDDEQSLMNERLAVVKSDLLATGVADTSVTVIEPTPFANEDVEGDINSPVLLTIYSVEGCRE